MIETQESPRREPVPLSVLLDDAIERVRRASDAARITIVLEDAAPGAIVECDRRQMVEHDRESARSNTVKYSEPDRRVCLGASVVVSDLVITVSDEGIGIPGLFVLGSALDATANCRRFIMRSPGGTAGRRPPSISAI